MNHIKRKETEEVNEAYNDNLGNDSFRWEMTGEDCTGFGDCDYYEYVMFPYKEPAEDFYWIIPKGRKYQLFTDRYSERPVEVFTSLKKAKQYAEELWLKEHEDYEIDESLNESVDPFGVAKETYKKLFDYYNSNKEKSCKEIMKGLYGMVGGRASYQEGSHSCVADGRVKDYTLYNSVSDEYKDGDVNRMIEDLTMAVYKNSGGDKYSYTPSLIKAIKSGVSESLNEAEKPDKKIVVGSTSGGIAVDFKPLSDKVSEVYNYLYNNNDTITVGNDRYSASSLSYDFDGYMQVNDEFKRLVREFTKWNGDYLSSDREAAAFIFALDALYPNIWDEIDKYTVNE